MVAMLATAAFFSLLAKLIDSPDQLRFLLIGNSVAAGAATAGWAIPASTWDRWDGTYSLLVIAPSSLVPAIMGRTSIWFASGVATSLIMFPVFSALFDLAFPWPVALLVVPLVMLTCGSYYCTSLFLGSLVARQPRIRNMIGGIASTVLRAFCGVCVPISFWPDSVQLVVQFLPVTHGLQAIRLVLDEASTGAILKATALEVAVGFGWIVVAILAMDRMANAGRADGSIEFV